MPVISPITLTVGSETEVYNPAASNGTQSSFADTSPGRMADWRTIRVTTRVAQKSNSGHITEVLLVRPIPVVDQDGCCVDKDAPTASTVTIRTLLSKMSTTAQADELVAAIRSYVNTADFAALVKGSSYY